MQIAERDADSGNQHKSKKGIVALVVTSFNTTEFLELLEKAFYHISPAPICTCWRSQGSVRALNAPQMALLRQLRLSGRTALHIFLRLVLFFVLWDFIQRLPSFRQKRH